MTDPTALVSRADGKAAELVVIAGHRAKNIGDGERVGTEYKDGVGCRDEADERDDNAEDGEQYCQLAFFIETSRIERTL